jgi:hypothetical protein
MTTVTLSQSTQNLISVALTQGPGANNQNYVAAYNAIYKSAAATSQKACYQGNQQLTIRNSVPFWVAKDRTAHFR